MARRLQHLLPVELPDEAGNEPASVRGVHPGPSIVQVLVAQAGVVVGEVDARLPGFGAQHDGRYIEPFGRVGDLHPEPVRVQEMADVGPG